LLETRDRGESTVRDDKDAALVPRLSPCLQRIKITGRERERWKNLK